MIRRSLWVLASWPLDLGVGFGVDGMKRKSPFSTVAIVISSSWASGQDFRPAYFGCVILRDG